MTLLKNQLIFTVWVSFVVLTSVLNNYGQSCPIPPIIEYKVGASSKEKYGWEGMVERGPAHVYRNYISVNYKHYIVSTNYEAEQTLTTTVTLISDDGPDVTTDISGTLHKTEDGVSCDSNASGSNGDWDDPSCAFDSSSFSIRNNFDVVYKDEWTEDSGIDSDSAEHAYRRLDHSGYFGIDDTDQTFSSEFTTSQLIQKMKTEADSQIATNDWGSAGAASYSIDADEIEGSYSKMKFRVKVPTEAETRYTISWDQITQVGTNVTTSKQQEIINGTGGWVTGKVHEVEPVTAREGSVIRVDGFSMVAEKINSQKGASGCSSCGGGNENGATSIPGSGATSLENGPQFNFGMGVDSFGLSSGNIFSANGFKSGTETPSLTDLSYTEGTPSEVITNMDGTLRQMKLAQGLADFASTSFEYSVSFYDAASVGALSNGVYQIDGSPFVTWKVGNPDGTNANNRFYVKEVRGSHTITNLYTYIATNATWEFNSGNGLRLERERSYVTNDDTIIEHLVFDATGTNVIEQSLRAYRTNENGVFLISEQKGTNAPQQFTYDSEGRISQKIDSTGYWESYTYDSEGRILEKVMAYGNAPAGSEAVGSRSITYDYTSLDASDDLSVEPWTPRTSTESILGNVISKTFVVVSPSSKIVKQGQWPGSTYSSSDNLVTVTVRYPDANAFAGREWTIAHSDGTREVYFYSSNATEFTTIVLAGEADSSNSTNVLSGTRTETTVGQYGQMLSRKTYDIVSGYLTAEEDHTDFDEFGRTLATEYLDGTSEGFSYDCCHLDATTNREGVVTSYIYDDLKRLTATVKNGVATLHEYDPAGRIVEESVQGTNGVIIVKSQMGYDLSGRLLASTNAVGAVTTYSEVIDEYGQTVRTTTMADSGEMVGTYLMDGTLFSTTGTATHPITYEYGVESTGDLDPTTSSGLVLPFTKEIKVDANANLTEWSKTYYDSLGREYKTIYSEAFGSYPERRNYYNSHGQLSKEVDPDGVQRLMEYNARGELEFTVVDMNRDGSRNASGTDRITQTISDVVSNATYHAVVRRSRMYVWDQNSVDQSQLARTKEVSVDGLKSWDTRTTAVSKATLGYSTGAQRFVTNTVPDGAFSVLHYQNGLLLSDTRYDSSGGQVSQTSFLYDAFNRRRASVDARNGTTLFEYDNADQVIKVTSPSAGLGEPAQVTSTDYDSMGRAQRITSPDGSVVTNLYYLSGELAMTFGGRSYPVGYGYDTQGRMITMTNWSNFEAESGARVTTWEYDPYRGFLARKEYDDGNGTDYTYSDAGRLATRAWARNVTTTYGYNNAGDLATVTYDDSTPGATYGYDRMGRRNSITRNSITTAITYDLANSRLSESYTGGTLSGLAVTNGFNSALQKTTVAVPGLPGALQSWTYDSAGRIDTDSDGTNNATYSYLANSGLIGQVLFKQGSNTRMTTQKDYDELNRLKSVVSTPSDSAVFPTGFAYRYNRANQRIRATAWDRSYWSYRYDALGQVTSGKKNWPEDLPVPGQQYEYGYDDIGNRTAVAFGGDENGVNLRSATYTANALNQYSSRSNPASVDIIGLAEVGSSVTVNGSGSTYRHGEYFQKDLGVTNNTFAAITVAAATNSLSGNLYIPPASESYSYDADGNLLADGRWSYLWDAENRLIEMRPQTNAPSAAKMWLKFEYDYLGRRIQKTAAQWTNSAWSLVVSNRFLYDGWNAIAELNATNNTLIRGYLWGVDLSGSLQGAGGVGGLIAVKEGTGNAHFAAYDGNGNIIALVNATTGTYSAQYEYDPFGQSIRATGPMAEFNPYRFSTKYQDGESGFYYYGHRYYNPSTGRWVSRDPIEEEGGVNLYAFVSNSPLRFIDVLGMSCDASYAFDDDDAWYEKTAYPRVTKWVRTMAQVKADMISKLKAGCCCFQNVYFSQHSGMPGVLLLGEGSVINPALLKMLQNATNQARQRVAREQLKRETEFLHFVSKFMCKGGTVTFVECDSGAGPEGKALHDWLVSVLGPDVNVTLFESGVRWFYGSPRCTTKSK